MATFMEVFLTTLLIGYASAYNTEFGWCDPTPTKMVDFDMDKFLGKWYISESFNAYDECMTWEFVRDKAPNTWLLIEKKESGLFHEVGLDHSNFNTAQIYRDFTTNSTSRMKIKWPRSITGDAFTVHNTDYVTYASVFECQNYFFAHRQNGLVLSRTPQLKMEIRQNARIVDENINVAYYATVRQGNCAYRYEEEKDKDLEAFEKHELKGGHH